MNKTRWQYQADITAAKTPEQINLIIEGAPKPMREALRAHAQGVAELREHQRLKAERLNRERPLRRSIKKRFNYE